MHVRVVMPVNAEIFLASY